jgi:hypothetical protein
VLYTIVRTPQNVLDLYPFTVIFYLLKRECNRLYEHCNTLVWMKFCANNGTKSQKASVTKKKITRFASLMNHCSADILQCVSESRWAPAIPLKFCSWKPGALTAPRLCHTGTWNRVLGLVAAPLSPFHLLKMCHNSRKHTDWRMVSSGMLRRVAFVRTDVSEEPSASFIRVTRIGELGTTLAATSNRRTLRRST